MVFPVLARHKVASIAILNLGRAGEIGTRRRGGDDRRSVVGVHAAVLVSPILLGALGGSRRTQAWRGGR